MSKSSDPSAKSPARLPQRSESWHLTVRKCSAWVEMDDGLPAHPYLMLLANLERELILEVEFNKDEPEADEVQRLLWRAMLKPVRELRQPPRRPQGIICDQETLVEALSAPLAEIGVEVSCQPQGDDLDRLVSLVEQEFGIEEDRLGLLSVPENTPERVGDLFAAAAETYRQAPWIFLSTEQPLKYAVVPSGKSGYVQLMGNSAIEYGLLLYESWQELERAYLNMGDPRPTLPENGWVSLSYAPASMLPPDDLQAIREYGWPVAGTEAYPLPMVLFNDRADPPDSPTLQAFTALLRALPPFVQALQPDLHGDYSPLKMEIPVITSAGERYVILEYPAGQLRREAFPREAFPQEAFSQDLFPQEGLPAVLPLDEADEDFLLDVEDASENIEIEEDETLADWEASPIAQTNPALVQAMALVYQAWEDFDPIRRIQFCRQALEISPDCAEAYVLLAEDLAVNLGQALKFYQKGVEAGERALGRDFFDRYGGEFWQHVEAHPYLRARAGLSQALWDLGRLGEALEHARELLRLDPDDNLSAHQATLTLLIETDQMDEAHHFAHAFNDPAAGWQYTTALLDFQKTGDSLEAKAQLLCALQANRFAPDYLSGRKRLPALTPDELQPGEKSEAIFYAQEYIAFWRRTPGAIDWLRKYARAEEKRGKPAPTQKSGKKKR